MKLYDLKFQIANMKSLFVTEAEKLFFTGCFLFSVFQYH